MPNDDCRMAYQLFFNRLNVKHTDEENLSRRHTLFAHSTDEL